MKTIKKQIKPIRQINQHVAKLDKNQKVLPKNAIITPKNINIQQKIKEKKIEEDLEKYPLLVQQKKQSEKQLKRQVKTNNNVVKNDLKTRSLVENLTSELSKAKDQLNKYQRQIQDYQVMIGLKENKIKELNGQISELKKQNHDLKLKNQKIKKAFDQNNKIIRNQINSYNQEASQIQYLNKQIQELKKQNQSALIILNKIDSCTNTQSTSPNSSLNSSISDIINHKKTNQITLQLQVQIRNDNKHTVQKEEFEQLLKKLKNQHKQKLNSIQSLSMTLNNAYNLIISQKEQQIHMLQEQIDRLYDEKQMGLVTPNFDMDEVLLRSIQQNQKLKNKLSEYKENNLALRIQVQQYESQNRRISNQLEIQRHSQTLINEGGLDIFQQEIIKLQMSKMKAQLTKMQSYVQTLTKQNKQKQQLIRMMSIKKNTHHLK